MLNRRQIILFGLISDYPIIIRRSTRAINNFQRFSRKEVRSRYTVYAVCVVYAYVAVDRYMYVWVLGMGYGNW